MLAEAESGPVSWDRVLLAYEIGDWVDAARLLGRVARYPGDSIRVQGLAGVLAALLGDAASARGTAAALEAMRGDFLFGEPAYWGGRIEAVLGNRRRAVALFRRAFAEGQGAPARYQLHVSRDVDALRDDPAFRSLIEPRGAGSAIPGPAERR